MWQGRKIIIEGIVGYDQFVWRVRVSKGRFRTTEFFKLFLNIIIIKSKVFVTQLCMFTVINVHLKQFISADWLYEYIVIT